MKKGLWLTLLALALSTQAGCGGQSPEQHIESAKRMVAKPDYISASIELKNALKKQADSAEARWLLGHLYLQMGDPDSARKELHRSLELGWSEDDILPDLARAMLALGDYEGIDQISYSGRTDSAAATILSIQALSALAQGDDKKAHDKIALAESKDPESLDVTMAQARIYARMGQQSDALAKLEQVLEIKPLDKTALALKTDILLQQGKLDAAITVIDQILKQEEDFGSRFKRAMIDIMKRDLVAAQTDTDVLLEMAPYHPASNYIQGIIHFQNEQYKSAITSLSLAEPASGQFPLILFYLGSAHLLEGNPDQAAPFATRFHSRAPGNDMGRKLLATVRLQQGDAEEVIELLEPLIDKRPNDPDTLNLMANALLLDGQTDQGLELLNKISQLQPDSPAAQIRLGAGLLLQGNNSAAEDHFAAAVELNPQFQQADILLVLNHLQNDDFDAAIAAGKSYRNRHPTKPTPHNLLGKVYQAAGQPDKAIKEFQTALTLAPADPAANHALAQLAIAKGDLITARAHYDTTLKARPDSLPTLMQLARLDAKEENIDGLVKHLEQAMNAHPRALEPKLMLARYYAVSGNEDQITTLIADLDESQKKLPQVLQLQALAQLSTDQHVAAQYTLEQLLERTPETAAYHHLLAVAKIGAGEPEEAKRELEKAVAMAPAYLPSLIALTRLAVNAQDAGDFNRRLDQLVELAPDSADVLRLRSLRALNNGELEKATDYSTRAYAAQPSTQTLLELAKTEQMSGASDTAADLLESWLQDNPNDVPVRMALATLLNTRSSGAASSQYTQVLELDPDNAVALNNLAWNLRLENPAKALSYARKAAELAPNRSEILDTLALVEHLNGDNQEAMKSIRRALKISPDSPSMLYHRAMIEVALNNTPTAIKLLESILATNGQSFPEKADAQALLNYLKG